MTRRSHPFNRRVRLFLLLVVELLNETAGNKGNNCYVTYSGGKMERHGDCQLPNWKNVVDDIEARAKAEQQTTTPSPNGPTKQVSEETSKPDSALNTTQSLRTTETTPSAPNRTADVLPSTKRSEAASLASTSATARATAVTTSGVEATNPESSTEPTSAEEEITSSTSTDMTATTSQALETMVTDTVTTQPVRHSGPVYVTTQPVRHSGPVYVTTEPVRHSGPVYENCTSDRTEAYFWIKEPHASDARYVTYSNGVEICANCSSVPAVIPDEDTFNEIANTIRHMYTIVGTPQLWLGVTVDQNTLKVDPPYAYVKWFSGHPRSGRPNVVVMVTSSNSNTKMMSTAGSLKTHGVICWKSQSSS